MLSELNVAVMIFRAELRKDLLQLLPVGRGSLPWADLAPPQLSKLSLVYLAATYVPFSGYVHLKMGTEQCVLMWL